MSDIYGDYNSEDVQYDSKYLPVGTHKVMIKSESREPVKNSNNEMLVLTFEAVEGEFKGKESVGRYNLWHSSEKASSIAKQQIKRIADATGRPANAANPLKGRVLNIEIAQQKGDARYTEIIKYSPAE